MWYSPYRVFLVVRFFCVFYKENSSFSPSSGAMEPLFFSSPIIAQLFRMGKPWATANHPVQPHFFMVYLFGEVSCYTLEWPLLRGFANLRDATIIFGHDPKQIKEIRLAPEAFYR
jgi:hypothetical protein